MKTLLLVSASLFIVSCAHHKDVRPGASGVHTIKLPTENKIQGYSNAKKQADHYCKQNKKRAFIVKEGTVYSGDMDEKSYNKAKTASKIAQQVGGAGYIFGGKKESDLGGIIGLGGGIANSSLGSGYTYSMSFTCK